MTVSFSRASCVMDLVCWLIIISRDLLENMRITGLMLLLYGPVPLCSHNLVLLAESILDSIINVSWRPFLPAVRPLIDDLVSTAFTDIFNKNFQNFPFHELFPR
jgi:hypothetical protein